MRIAILASREVKRNKPYRVRRMGKTWCFGETATEKIKALSSRRA